MKETKISLLRSFGTEQFSITVTLDENARPAQLYEALTNVDIAIFKMLEKTEERGIKERELLAKSAERRTASILKLEEELKAETEAKKSLGASVKVAEKQYNKNNK